MQTLTTAQARVYNFVRDTIAARQAPPTRAEIADALGFASPNAAQSHLRTLAHKGYIALRGRSSRSISLIESAYGSKPESDESTVALAVIGRVPADGPILAVANVERRCRLDPGLFAQPPNYLLRVSGDSMTGAGIFDADLIAVACADEIKPGAIGVFRVDGEVTVKRFQRQAGNVLLRAENPAYNDIHVDPSRDSLTLEGLAVGVVRAL